MRRAAIAALAAVGPLALTAPALPHDVWANGEPVPAWVKHDCCGQSDAHHIPNEAVRIMADGYHIEGISAVVPFSRAQPSPDNSYWGFWNPSLVPDAMIYCFFAPPQGS